MFTGSYDIEAAYCHMTAVYTNKAPPGGVAYACSFRITEAVYFVERLVDCLAHELKVDPAQLRLANLLRADQFPYKSKTGWLYDSGDYETTMRLAMDMIGYDQLRAEQAEKRARGELMGIGMSFFTEAVGAGPRKDMDILGLGMADGCELRIHPTGKAVLRLSVQTQGAGPRDDVRADRSRGARHSAGRYRRGARRHRPDPVRLGHLWQPVHTGFRRGGRVGGPQDPRQSMIIASGMLEASVADLEWDKGSFHIKGDPSAAVTIQDIAMRAHGAGDLPEGLEGGLDARSATTRKKT